MSAVSLALHMVALTADMRADQKDLKKDDQMAAERAETMGLN